MPARPKLIWKVYAGLLGAATTLITQRVLTVGWKLATGGEPPDVTDPETPLRTAVVWASASGLGLIVSQLLMGRFTARRWSKDYAGSVVTAGRVTWSL